MGALSDLVDSAKDKVMSTIKDIAAKGTTVYNTNPPNGRSAKLDIGSMAEDQARSQGRGSTTSPMYKTSPLASPMTPVSKKGQ